MQMASTMLSRPTSASASASLALDTRRRRASSLMRLSRSISRTSGQRTSRPSKGSSSSMPTPSVVVVAAAAAAVSSAAAASYDDGEEDEVEDEDYDPFEDWDDLPSISPSSSSEEGTGGISGLRSFTDALRGEMTAEEEAFAAVISGEMEPERAFLVAVGPKGGGGRGRGGRGDEDSGSAADALAAAVAAFASSSSSSSSPASSEDQYDDFEEEQDEEEEFEENEGRTRASSSSSSSSSTYTTAESLDELASLAETAGLAVVGRMSQALPSPNPRTYVNAGKISEIAAAVVASRAETVIFDDELTPAQARNLESALENVYNTAGAGGTKTKNINGAKKVRICDRTALILDIFAQRAASREGLLQVELAQAEYQLPRLTRMWSHLERQSGSGRVKGMGEKQIEVDKRLLRSRAAALRKEIDAVRRERASRRAARAAARVPVVALVGYTSAGKSSLLNALTGATALADDAPFATLDPTTRRLPGLPGGKEALLTDTVGFIQKLPTQLVAAFRATLEEAVAADLLIHVVDVAHPSAAAQSSTVSRVLGEIGVDAAKPTIVAWNKIDAADAARGAGAADAARRLAEGRVGERETVCVSAATGEGLDDLRGAVAERLAAALSEYSVTLLFPFAPLEGKSSESGGGGGGGGGGGAGAETEGGGGGGGGGGAQAALSRLRRSGAVLLEVFTPDGVVVEASAADAAEAEGLARRFGLGEEEFAKAVLQFGGGRDSDEEDGIDEEEEEEEEWDEQEELMEQA